MSMQIRTVVHGDPGVFDKSVNQSIKDGWKLTKRERVSTPAGTEDYLYAELVKEDEPITWQQAVGVIKGICGSREDCLTGDNECPLFRYCHDLTVDWGVPTDWPEVPHD